MKNNLIVIFFAFIPLVVAAQKPRARDIEISFDGIIGKFNAVTDVKDFCCWRWFVLRHYLFHLIIK